MQVGLFPGEFDVTQNVPYAFSVLWPSMLVHLSNQIFEYCVVMPASPSLIVPTAWLVLPHHMVSWLLSDSLDCLFLLPRSLRQMTPCLGDLY